MVQDPLKLNDVARMLKVAAVTVRAWTEKGMLTAERTPGGHRRYRKEEVLRFAQAHQIAIDRVDTNRRILIVDDDQRWLSLMQTLIRNADQSIEIETASSGFAAGQQLGRFNPDIVLLDIRMPGISGFEVCQSIKAANISARIIAISGYATEEEEMQLRQAGAECCLRKPVDFDRLLALIALPALAI